MFGSSNGKEFNLWGVKNGAYENGQRFVMPIYDTGSKNSHVVEVVGGTNLENGPLRVRVVRDAALPVTDGQEGN